MHFSVKLNWYNLGQISVKSRSNLGRSVLKVQRGALCLLIPILKSNISSETERRVNSIETALLSLIMSVMAKKARSLLQVIRFLCFFSFLQIAKCSNHVRMGQGLGSDQVMDVFDTVPMHSESEDESERRKLTTCGSGHYLSGGSCTIVPAGSYPVGAIAYNSPIASWQDIAVSSDFMSMVATVRSSYIKKSTDGGASWFDLIGSGQRPWETITASDDLSKIAAATDGSSGNIFLSTDGGSSFNVLSGAGSKYYHGVAATSNFVNIATAVWSGYIYKSTNSGATFSLTSAPSESYWDITVSEDFNTMIATVRGGYLQRTSDSGATWNSITSAGSESWWGISASSDFTKLVATTLSFITISYDSGLSWNTITSSTISGNMAGLAVSDDFTKAVVVVSGGNVYHSTGSGLLSTSTTFSDGNGIGVVSSGATGTAICTSRDMAISLFYII